MSTDHNTVDYIQTWLGERLPSEYQEFLEVCELYYSASERVVLYGRSMFIERNETYETKDYCPGYVTVGNDSGDCEFLMSLQDASIYLVDGGAMQIQTAEPLHLRFAEWLKSKCPIPEVARNICEWPVDPLTKVFIYLETRPLHSSSLLLIKKQLGIATSIADLKKALDRIPCRITDEVTYANAKNFCRGVNKVDPCIGSRLASDETVRLP